MYKFKVWQNITDNLCVLAAERNSITQFNIYIYDTNVLYLMINFIFPLLVENQLSQNTYTNAQYISTFDLVKVVYLVIQMYWVIVFKLIILHKHNWKIIMNC